MADFEQAAFFRNPQSAIDNIDGSTRKQIYRQ